MEENKNKNIIVWIIIAVIVVAVVVYVVLSGGLNLPEGQEPEGGEGEVTEQVAPGASAVTEEGEVLNAQGETARNDVEPGTPEAPQQSDPVSVEDLPSSVIKLSVTASGFSPSSFTVDAGSVVSFSITSGDAQTHLFKFDDPSLSGVAIGVAPKETRVSTFKAPKKGEYTFSCGVPGHAGRGETGVMIVK